MHSPSKDNQTIVKVSLPQALTYVVRQSAFKSLATTLATQHGKQPKPRFVFVETAAQKAQWLSRSDPNFAGLRDEILSYMKQNMSAYKFAEVLKARIQQDIPGFDFVLIVESGPLDPETDHAPPSVALTITKNFGSTPEERFDQSLYQTDRQFLRRLRIGGYRDD